MSDRDLLREARHLMTELAHERLVREVDQYVCAYCRQARVWKPDYRGGMEQRLDHAPDCPTIRAQWWLGLDRQGAS